MKSIAAILLALVLGVVMSAIVHAADAKKISTAPAANTASPLNKPMKSLSGQDVNPAEKYAGKVVLLVNVASKCGLTKQYKELQALDDKYSEQGLAIVGVPCNQFNGQEPGTPLEIAAFCSANYGVKFDLLEKVDVNGDSATPLYKEITAMETAPQPAGPIQWNFEKFLFNRDGKLVARFAPRTTPDAPEVIAAIEEQLSTQ
jgi:glutathione peroxidase